jgi:hypothetical protein
VGGKYRFCLDNVQGRVGLTDSHHVPTVRIQPRAELLHAIGPADTVQMMTEPFEAALGPLTWSVSRVDVHSDWQGLSLHRSMSEHFVSRALARTIYEDGTLCTGFTFGVRTGAGIYARLYDKVAEINLRCESPVVVGRETRGGAGAEPPGRGGAPKRTAFGVRLLV